MAWLKEVLLVLLGEGLALLLGLVVFSPVLVMACLKSDVVRGSDLPNLARALDLYFAKTGHMPSELDTLVSAKVMEKVPMDPLGKPYLYELRGGLVRLASLGRDGLPGGAGASADIECWKFKSSVTATWIQFCSDPNWNAPAAQAPTLAWTLP